MSRQRRYRLDWHISGPRMCHFLCVSSFACWVNPQFPRIEKVGGAAVLLLFRTRSVVAYHKWTRVQLKLNCVQEEFVHMQSCPIFCCLLLNRGWPSRRSNDPLTNFLCVSVCVWEGWGMGGRGCSHDALPQLFELFPLARVPAQQAVGARCHAQRQQHLECKTHTLG